jgi:hypothetical protein
MNQLTYILALLATATLLSACGGEDTNTTTHLYPLSIEMRDAPGLDNRHDFEITGPDWETPHTKIGDAVWHAGAYGVIEGDHVRGLRLDEPAPYTQNTPLNLHATFRWDVKEGVEQDQQRPDELRVEARALLTSTTAPDREPVELFAVDQFVPADQTSSSDTAVEFSSLDVLTDALPERIDLWQLTIRWTLTAHADGEPVDEPSELRTTHRVPTSWRGPTSDVRLYRETVLWSSMWAAGSWAGDEEHAEDSTHQISERLMQGVGTLGNFGYEYGTFDRPPKDEIDDRADVFLDFERSACGEFRGILMNLIEYHGIDASWVWWKKSHDNDSKLGIYKTRKLAAVGRKAKHWFNTNHIVVAVDGRIYDPTYTVSKPSFEDYEDWMFEKYCRKASDFCRGECDLDSGDERRHCVDNPPGLEDGDFEIIRGSNYR